MDRRGRLIFCKLRRTWFTGGLSTLILLPATRSVFWSPRPTRPECSTAAWPTRRNGARFLLLVDMHDPGRGEAVEPGGGGIAIGPDGFAIKQVVQLQIRQILGEGDGVQGVAGLAEDGADFGLAAPEGFEVVLAMIEDDARESAINAV